MRKKLSAVISFMVLLAFVFTPAYAKDSKSHGKKKDVKEKEHVVVKSDEKSTPPGWSEGKKVGWHGSKYPPGWTKWEKNKKAKWIQDRDGAVIIISQTAASYKIPRAKQNEILSAFEEAVVGGVVINNAKDRLVSAMKDENQRKNMMLDTTQTVLELLKD